MIAPILAAYDEHCRRGLLGAYCEGLALRYEQLPVNTGALPWTLALVDLGPQTLSMVRRWLWVRCSGRWPPSQVMPTGPTLRDFAPGAVVRLYQFHMLCATVMEAVRQAGIAGSSTIFYVLSGDAAVPFRPDC